MYQTGSEEQNAIQTMLSQAIAAHCRSELPAPAKVQWGTHEPVGVEVTTPADTALLAELDAEDAGAARLMTDSPWVWGMKLRVELGVCQ